MQTYLVGGAVRDALLNYPSTERDYVVVGATPQHLLDLGYRLIAKDFPVFLHPTTQAEYALARTERKIGAGYAGFSCYAAPDVTLEADLQRRDLTINAMAQSEDGTIIDPYHGRADLAAKLLRHVSDAFIEDPVRILRVARFAARYAHLGFTIAPETLQLMQTMVSNGEVNALVPERVWLEFKRSLTERTPQRFIQVLRDCGALKILLPEIDRLFGVPNPPQWHPEIDTGVHTLLVLEQAALLSPEPTVRFAALVHDLGKGTTPIEIWPSHTQHGERGVAIIHSVAQRYLIPHEYTELAIMTSRFHSHCHRVFELKAATLLKTLEQLDAFRRPARFELFLLACEADARGRAHLQTQPYPQRARMQQALNSAQQITARPFIAQGLTGAALGTALQQARIAALQQVLHQ